MKTALITTTINVPTVLKLYRELHADAMFFVAGDLKTPLEADIFCGEMDKCIYMSLANQQMLNYKSDKLNGDNTDSKRNIALLEALRWGADLIVSIDDDMIPCQGEWVQPGLFEWRYDGLQFGQPGHWFDAGLFTTPPAPQRGLPYLEQPLILNPSFVVNAKIGAAQGIILGVPDTDAATSIVKRPLVTGVSDVLRNGFVVHPKSFAVMNSQITAFRRELAPAFAQYYSAQGRNTDIMASLLMRRVMQERDFYTFYGCPMGYHARQPRPLVNDLKAERYGVETIVEYADYLNCAPLPDVSVVDQCRILTEGWKGPESETAMAWYDDVEAVL